MITTTHDDLSSSNQHSTPFSVCYDELRRLATARLRRWVPGQTLNVTALVNETYVKLMRSRISKSDWEANRSQFLALAAEAMRQIVVDHVRKRHRLKRGGDVRRHKIDVDTLPTRTTSELILEVNDAIELLELTHPDKAKLVKLRFFVGLTMHECAQALGISTPTAERHWRYARAWLAVRMAENS